MLKEARFFSARKHVLFHNKTKRSHLSEKEIYERKKQARIIRQQAIKKDSSLQDFILWIRWIKERLEMTNAQFAEVIGIESQTVKLWLRGSGHFPSTKNYNKLLRLEKQARLNVTTSIKIRIIL